MPLSASRPTFLIGAALIALPAAAKPAAEAWANTHLTPEARAAALVKAMTPDEKFRIVHGWFPPFVIGKPGIPTDMIPSAGYVPGVPRLGIPNLRESDASLGVANQVEQRKGDTATALPASLATAASFDPAVAYAGGAMAGSEARAKTFNVLLAGGANLTRDPWGGRNFEYMGEDPLLSGIMAGASIKGVQSNGIVSTVKHFVLNSQETGRTIGDARISEAPFRESDLLAFEIAIEKGQPGSVMCAYNRINGDHACENAFTLTDVLRRDWHYGGFVMSDWGAVHSTVKAANAGLDQDSGQELDSQIFFDTALREAVTKGEVPQSRIDSMVRHILTGVIASGLYDRPTPATAQPIDTDAHALVAQKAAEEGIVLLRNKGGLLPIAATARRILLVGGHADVGVLSGGGSSQVRSIGGVPVEIPLKSGPAASFARITWHNSSPRRALQAALPNAQISYLDGSDPAATAMAAKHADLVIVFATQWRTEAEDITTLSLPDNQDALIDAIAAANPKTAVILESGGAVTMPWLDGVGAVIAAWYPGQRGGEALANILTGKVNPSGHLPLTFPMSLHQAPRPEPVNIAAFQAKGMEGASDPGSKMATVPPPFPIDYDTDGSDVGYRWYARTHATPLFPFGFGLSYTSFRYANLKVVPGKALTVSFDVTNSGKRAGADVPQLYVSGRYTARLAGFQRVRLAPGETKHITLVAEPRVLASWDTVANGWHIASGSYSVSIGHHAGDMALSTNTRLEDQRLRP